MSTWNLLWTIVLIYAQRTDTLWVTTVPSSTVEVAVSGYSTYFTLQTCSHAVVELGSITSTYPKYAIYINKDDGWLSAFYEPMTFIQYTEANGEVVNVAKERKDFQTCNRNGTFWLSWEEVGLKFGEGVVGSAVTLEALGFNQQVEHLTISTDAVAEWHFPEVTATTTKLMTSSKASSGTVTIETNTETTQAEQDTRSSDSETELETDTNVHINSSDTERTTDFGSKSSAPESFSQIGMSAVLTLCSFAVVKSMW